jgi:hypothetical protein
VGRGVRVSRAARGERGSEEEEVERRRKKKKEKEKERERVAAGFAAATAAGRAHAPVGDAQRVAQNEGKKGMGRRMNSGVGTAKNRREGLRGIWSSDRKRFELSDEKVLKIIFGA